MLSRHVRQASCQALRANRRNRTRAHPRRPTERAVMNFTGLCRWYTLFERPFRIIKCGGNLGEVTKANWAIAGLFRVSVGAGRLLFRNLTPRSNGASNVSCLSASGRSHPEYSGGCAFVLQVSSTLRAAALTCSTTECGHLSDIWVSTIPTTEC